MLQDFLALHRAELIDRCRRETSRRPIPAEAKDATLTHGIPLFLDQTIETLRREQAGGYGTNDHAGQAGDQRAVLTELRATAARHGVEQERHGFSIAQVVHVYGDLCQAITDLAFELGARVQVREFRTLNWCLDNAIAHAVTEFHKQRELDSLETNAEETQLQLGALAHEMRSLVHTATLAFDVARDNGTLRSGPGVTTLQKSLVGLGGLIDRTLADVRLSSRVPARPALFSVSAFIAEAAASAQLEASIRGCALSVSPVDPALRMDADRDLLLAALANLLQNAMKFSPPDSEVSLRTYASVDRIFIEVEDRCGGLSADELGKMFLPFQQHRADRSGLGLGLFICGRSVAASGGVLGVRDLPGCGCVFTIQLPHYAMPVPLPVYALLGAAAKDSAEA